MTPCPAPPRVIARALLAAVTLLALAAPAAAEEPEVANFDARQEAAATLAPAQRRALDRVRERLGRFADVSVDEATGTVRSVRRLGGFLTAPSGRTGADVTLDYVREHAQAFGLDAGDVAGLQLVDRTFAGGVERLGWEQRHRGLPVADAGLQAVVTGAGRLVSVTGPPAPDVEVEDLEPAVTASAAYAAARQSGHGGAGSVTVAEREPGAERPTRFADGGRASLTIYPADAGFRLAWRVLAPVSSSGVYDVLIDARSGAVVRRINRVKFATADVFEYTPADAAPITVDLGLWLTSDDALSGPNVHAFSDVADLVPFRPGSTTWDLTPGNGSEVDPDDGPFPLVTSGAGGGANGCQDAGGTAFPTDACTWNPAVPGSWEANREQSATQLFYLVNRFSDHLRLDPDIAFVDGGFRDTGQPRGNPDEPPEASASDPIIAQAMDGATTGDGVEPAPEPQVPAGRPDRAHRNNASFLTLPDGVPGLLQMQLWMPQDYFLAGDGTYQPFNSSYGAYDGANDASLVFHELTHGLSDRLVTDAAGQYGALTRSQSGAIAEGTSDFYSLDFLAQHALADDGPGADLHLGRYLDGGDGTFRYQPIDCVPVAPPGPADPACDDRGTEDPELQRLGGLTLADFGEVFEGPEVHADGEIWAQTLWSIRAALIADDPTLGLARARRYITNGMRDAPPEPSFLDMRNAILQQAGLEDKDDLLWTVFAERGMGYFAAAEDGDDVAPIPDFTGPSDLTGTGSISGEVRDEEGAPLPGARVGIAGRDSGLGPDRTDLTGADGTFEIEAVPVAGDRTYPVVRAHKPGFEGSDGSERAVDVPVGTTDLELRLLRDWSSAALGATTVPAPSPTGTCGVGDLIDDDRGSVWSARSEGGGRSVVVELAKPVDVERVSIDPSAGCGDPPSAALAGYEVLAASSLKGEFRRLREGAFTPSDLGAFQPVFLGDARGVRYLKLHAKTPQGAGPYIDVAELQVRKVPGSPIGAAAETGAAPVVGFAGATVTGKVIPHGAPADVIFEYGTTTAYGAPPVSAGRTGSGDATYPVTAAISGLAPSTTYHYRVVALRDGRRYEGGDATFTTAAAPPPRPTPTPTPTPTPAPPPPDPADPVVASAITSTKLTADRRGRFKVRWTFGDAAPDGKARISVIGKRRKRIASAQVAVRAGRAVTKTLRLTKAGRRMIKRGSSRRVTLELRLPGGGTLRERVRLSRKR